MLVPVGLIVCCPMHILLIENNENDTLLITTALENAGGRSVKVDHRTNIATAVKAISEHSYELVITDLNLPDGDAFELLDSLSSEEIARTVVISGDTHPDQIEAASKIGVRAFVEKPLDKDTIEDMLSGEISGSTLDGDGRGQDIASFELVDETVLDILKDELGSAAVIGELIDTYLGQLPKLINKLLKGFDQKDLELVSDTAHTLKSPSYALGANKIAEVARVIESYSDGGDIDSAATRRNLLLKTAEDTTAAFKNIRATIKD